MSIRQPIIEKSFSPFPKIVLLIITYLLIGTSLHSLEYDVEFKNLNDKELRKVIKASSQTIKLQDKPPSNIQKLKKRAENDIAQFKGILEYFGYYNAKVTLSISRDAKPKVRFDFNLGKLFTIHSFLILPAQQERLVESAIFQHHLPQPFNTLSPREFKIEIGKPASTQQILEAEKAITTFFKAKGYPFCKIIRRQVYANSQKHTLDIHVYVSEGPQACFGNTKITGNTTVLPEVIEKYICWKKGERYDPQKIENTQKMLEKLGLFSSLIISDSPSHFSEGMLPMEIQVQESKLKSISAGINYTTTFGPGLSLGWEHRNFRGLGEKLSFNTQLWEKYQTAILSWTLPHYKNYDQNLIWIGQYQKQQTLAFNYDAESFSGVIEKQFTKTTSFTYGGTLERLHSKSYEGNRLYYIAKIPLSFKWSSADSLFDPTRGLTLSVKGIPAHQFYNRPFDYLIHTTTVSAYHSIKDNFITFAMKGVLGNILGASRRTIPPPDRFYGGTDNTFRGYKALTVSPLRKKRIPIGGRSILAGSFEVRFRMNSGLGWVFFYDIGNVYKANFPTPNEKQLHSVGTGIRYATPIGPLRFDIGVPLNRRRHIDSPVQIYFSIGQSF